MPSMKVAKIFLRELLTTSMSTRQAEPDLVMDDADKVAAYTRAGREDGVMQPVYLFNCAQISQVIKPGDIVLDLGCGPATQLGLVARLNPDINFIGVDLSSEMLNKARAHIDELNLTNVEFLTADISSLEMLADNSIDAVMSTVVLHHLPDVEALDNAFRQIERVLKPAGGLFLLDFGHLKSEKSIEEFAYQYADRQPELFTLDYLYSLRAAFSSEDFGQRYQKYLRQYAGFYKTFIMPFMVAIKSPARRDLPVEIMQSLQQIYHSMPDYHKTDFQDLAWFFRLGGMNVKFTV